MRINHNIAALNTYSRLSNATLMQSKSLEKLSSGMRINRAGDDAAGLAISEKMRAQIRGLEQATRNAQDGISLIQTAEGALNETHAMIQRMRELVVQANNDTNNSDDLNAIQDEIDELISEINRIAEKTTFNDKNLLDGSLGTKIKTGGGDEAVLTGSGVVASVAGIASGKTITFAATNTYVQATVDGVSQKITGLATTISANSTFNFDKLGLTLEFSSNFTAANLDSKTLQTAGTQASFQIGPNENTTLDVSISSMKAADLGKGNGGSTQDLSSVDVVNNDFADDIKAIDKALNDVSSQRAQLGAWQNRLEHTINNLTTSAENLTAAESRIRDVDMAKEMMEFTKNNILNQAATAMLAQANQLPQGVLQLLR